MFVLFCFTLFSLFLLTLYSFRKYILLYDSFYCNWLISFVLPGLIFRFHRKLHNLCSLDRSGRGSFNCLNDFLEFLFQFFYSFQLTCQLAMPIYGEGGRSNCFLLIAVSILSSFSRCLCAPSNYIWSSQEWARVGGMILEIKFLEKQQNSFTFAFLLCIVEPL